MSALPSTGRSVETTGRFTAGSYFATETFAEPDLFTGDRNDVQTVSGRAYLKVAGIAGPDDSFVTDLRDKHDFFDKVDKEKLQLTDNNELQVRQLSYGSDRTGLAFRLGRFPIQDAGAVTIDGINLMYREQDWKTYAFAGLNPVEYGKAYLQWRPNAQTYGAGLSFVPRDFGTGAGGALALASSTAFVQESFSNQTDRSYLYQNLDFSIARTQRLYANLFLDFVPKAQVQNGFFMVESKWASNFKTNLSYLTIDTVQYVRRQDVREQLAPSAYSEISIDTRFLSNAGNDWSLDFLSGTRAFDGKTRTLGELKTRWAQVGDRKNWDLAAGIKAGKNFESNDWSARLECGYYSRRWEAIVEHSYGTEEYSTVTYHPMATGLSFGHILDRSLFATVSGERIADERVEILSVLVRLSYRFGSRGVAPIRDGSPPRGAL